MGRPCSSSRFVSSSLNLRRFALAALVWWCVLAASLQAATAQRNAPPGQVKVRVGVILNLTSSIGQRRKVGIEMAVEDYYAAHPGSRTRVALRFRDSGGQVVGAASAGKLLALVSEFRDTLVLPVRTYCKQIKYIPLLA
jgi:glutamate receptor, ionotropic, plant